MIKYYEMVYHDALRYVGEHIDYIRTHMYSNCLQDELFTFLWENPEVTGTDSEPYCKSADEAKRFVVESIDEVTRRLKDYNGGNAESYAEIGKAFCDGNWQLIDNAVRHEVLCINNCAIVDMVIRVMKQTCGDDYFKRRVAMH